MQTRIDAMPWDATVERVFGALNALDGHGAVPDDELRHVHTGRNRAVRVRNGTCLIRLFGLLEAVRA